MNKFISNLERKFGKYAIPRLPLVMIICYAIGYIMQLINPTVSYFLSLNPYAILHGQVWRLISWLLIPPSYSNLFGVLIMLYFYYSIGTTLEKTWGTFYYNYYIFSGIFFTILASFLLFGYCQIFDSSAIEQTERYYTQYLGQEAPFVYGGSYYYLTYSLMFSTYYVNMSIFLAFAATYPDMQVLLMFILPIKVKVLGIIYAVILVVEAIQGGPMLMFVIGASLLNFILFFLATRKSNLNAYKRRKDFERKASGRDDRASGKVLKMRRGGDMPGGDVRVTHKCAICGRTSTDYPSLQFRFCSQCEGNYEFCEEHLYTHKHFKRQ